MQNRPQYFSVMTGKLDQGVPNTFWVTGATPQESNRSRQEKNLWKSSKFKCLFLTCQAFVLTLTLGAPTVAVLVSYAAPAAELFSFALTCFVSVYVPFNLIGNWVSFKRNFILKDTNRRSAVRNLADNVTVAVCADCSCVVRSEVSHCPICDVCIFRRDHHCFFLGKCVSLSNLRNFVAFCFHAFVGSWYCLLLLTSYLNLEYRRLWSSEFPFFLIPYALAKWMGDSISTSHFLSVLLLNTLLIVCVSTLLILILNVYLIFTWKTSYEFWNKQETFYRSSLKNFKRALGKNWGIAFLIPKIQPVPDIDKQLYWDYTKSV